MVAHRRLQPRERTLHRCTDIQLCSCASVVGMPTTPDPSPRPRWPLERALFALAGTVTLSSALLAAVVSPWFLLLTAFVGLNQWLFVLAGDCPASLIARRVFGLRSARYPGAACHR